MRKRTAKNLKLMSEETNLSSPLRRGKSMPNCKITAGASSRKTLRKQARLQKKEKRRSYFSKQALNTSNGPLDEPSKNTKKTNQSKEDPELAAKQARIKAEENLKKIQAKRRRRLLIQDNEHEEKNIKKLEKRLKMNKRKSKSLPKVFLADGLDYILDVCNPDTVNNFKEMELDECDSDFSEDFALATGQSKQADGSGKTPVVSHQLSKTEGKVRPKKHLEPSDSEESDEASDDSSMASDGESDEEMDETLADDEEYKQDVSNEEDEDTSNKSIDKKSDEHGMREDIYGRLVNVDGTVLSSKRYVPPSLRTTLSTEDDQVDLSVERLSKQLKGLLNRLSESNMLTIVKEIEDLYMRHSRNNMNSVLIKLILEAIVQTVATPERLVQEHCMLIAILHANIGPEVGARMIEILVNKFNDLHQDGNYGEGKECENLLLIMVHLYTFKVISAVLVYDVLDLLINSFQEKCIELILLILRSAGFTLRKDDPLRLKNIIVKIQTQAKATQQQFQDQSRVQFMLDTLLAIRNNNMHKIPNYDVSHREHLRKILRNFIRKGNNISELKMSMNDLLEVESKGRWWIVGSSWAGKVDTKETATTLPTVDEQQEPVSDKILDLAMKLHINTDIRKNIFSVIMTAEDYVDAFEKILKLSLKNAQEKESIYVAMECCLQEKIYNPYYGYLLQKFCTHDRKYQMMVQFSVWDRLKELHSASDLQISNLSNLLTHLILTKAMAISVLKVIHFSDINKPTVRFLRQTLLKLLLHEPHKDMEEVFTRVAGLPKLYKFREGLRLFMRHFMLKNKNKLPSTVNVNLESRIETAESALQISDNTIRF